LEPPEERCEDGRDDQENEHGPKDSRPRLVDLVDDLGERKVRKYGQAACGSAGSTSAASASRACVVVGAVTSGSRSRLVRPRRSAYQG
jgi:hypothetical protein